MRKDRLNGLFRGHVRNHLSPTAGEREFVASVYESVQAVLGAGNSLQIGSYPRFTAITPLHDLDVLYLLGRWDPLRHDPAQALEQLERRLLREYKNPTHYRVEISRQTHSVTIKYLAGADEVFAVDVVPAYLNGTNEFGEDTYVVPEIAAKSSTDRRKLRQSIARGEREMAWIASDPRGYIAVAARLNRTNDDFRKAVKFTKGWRTSCKTTDPDFPLKSFHLEQAITRWMSENPDAEIFDAVFEFFCALPDFIRYPQFQDRADSNRNIDDYVAYLSETDRQKVIEARDGFLIKLENLEDGDDTASLLAVSKRKRRSPTEAYLFDSRIPVLTEHEFSIIAEAQARDGGFRRFILDRIGLIQVDREIRFRLAPGAPIADVYKWKVKNDDDSPKPRGEITDHGTLQDPECTQYNGSHFVECFAIHNAVCIGRSKQNVVLKSQW